MKFKFKGTAALVSVAVSALVLAGCSSGSKSSTPAPDTEDAGSNLIVGESASGMPADDVSSLELRKTAAGLASSSLGLNINEVLGIGLQDDSETVTTGIDGMNVVTVSDSVPNADMLDDNVDSLLKTSLAVEDTSLMVSRDGNVITVDPDDTQLCTFEQIDGTTSIDQQCLEIVKDLTVVLDAKTDDTGIVTYQYQQESVLSVGYSPNGGSYEINMGGLKSVIETLAASDPQLNANLPDTMQGAMRVTAIVDDTSGVEAAGSMSLSVTEALNIVDTDGNININLGKSELFKVSSDAAGNSTIASNLGALSASLPALLNPDPTNPDAPADMVSIMAGAFTSQLDINGSGNEIKVGNSGTTFTLGINSGEAVRINVSNFGMTINSDGISIDPGLTLGTSLTSVISQYTDAALSSATFNVAMPTGTVITNDETATESAVKVESGGFSYALNANGPQGAFNSSFAASAGDCFRPPIETYDNFGNLTSTEDIDAPLVTVDCGAP